MSVKPLQDIRGFFTVHFATNWLGSMKTDGSILFFKLSNNDMSRDYSYQFHIIILVILKVILFFSP